MYFPSNVTRIIESDWAIFFENVSDSRSSVPNEVVFREECVVILVLVTSSSVEAPPLTEGTKTIVENHVDDTGVVLI